MNRELKIWHLYLSAFCGIALIGLALQILSFTSLRSSLWGFHFYSFLSPVFIIIAGVLIVAYIARLFLGGSNKGWQESENGFIERKTFTAGICLSLLFGLILYLLRSRQLFLGDALPLTINLPEGQNFHPRQPLTMSIQQLLYQYIGPLVRAEGMTDAEVARQAVSIGSIAAGMLYALTAVYLGRFLAKETDHQPRTAWFVTFILLSQGYIQLFAGYVENYTYYALALIVYLYTALRFARGKARLLLPGLALVIGIVLHLSALVLIPSFAVLAVFALTSSEKRRAGLVDLAVCALAFLAVHLVFIKIWGYNLFSSIYDISLFAIRQKEEFIPGYLFSWQHLIDFFNEQYLIGPFSLFAFIPASYIALRRSDRGRLPSLFMLTAGISFLAISLMANDSNLGYARNWDLLAPAGICFTTAALFFILKHIPPAHTRLSSLLAFACIVSVVHTLPWIWINHNEELAFKRFKTLPLGMGRTEFVTANWHLRNGQPGEAVEWLRRSLRRNQENAPAHALLGQILTDRELFEEARRAYSRAVELRKDKVEYRNNYMMVLLKLGRDEEAARQLEILTGLKPESRKYWAQLAGALIRLDRTGDDYPLFEQLLSSNQSKLESDPDNREARIKSCAFLILLGREEAAELHLRRLADTQPSNCHACAFLGAILKHSRKLERAQEIYSAAVNLCPENILYRDIYTMTLLQLGRNEKALEQLKILSEVKSEREKYLELMAEVLARLGCSEEVSSVYRKLLHLNEEKLKSDPGSETANIKAGTYLMLLGRGNEALRRFKKALQANPSSLAALFNIGSALLNMGRAEEAVPYLRKFIKLYPEHPRADWARMQLEKHGR